MKQKKLPKEGEVWWDVQGNKVILGNTIVLHNKFTVLFWREDEEVADYQDLGEFLRCHRWFELVPKTLFERLLDA